MRTLLRMRASGYTEWLAFFAVAILGFGSSFYWIKVAVSDISPLELVTFRSTISALFLWTAVYFLHIPLPKRWPLICKILFAGVMGGALPNALISYGEVYVDSSITGILIGLCPTFTVVFTALLTSTHDLSINKIVGVILGFCGVYIILSPDLQPGMLYSHLWPEAAIILAAMCYSLFGVYAKLNFTKEHPIALAAISATASAIAVVSSTLWQKGIPQLPSTVNTWCAVLWIGVVTSAISQILVYHLVRTWGPARLSMITYIMPLVALWLGVMCLGERPSDPDLGGGALILASIYFVNTKRKPKAQELKEAKSSGG